MNLFKRSAGIATGAALVMVLTAACGSSDTSSSSSKEIVIGMPIAESGFLNVYDGPMLIGAQMAVKEINAKGGVDGKKIRIVTANTQSEVAQVATAAKKVLSEGAQFLIPSQDYDLGSPAARVGETQNPAIPSISLAGDPRFGLLGIGKHTYNVWQGGPVEGGAAASWAYETKGLRHPYVLTDPTLGYSQSLGKYFKYSWEKLAGNDSIAGEDTFQNADASIATQVARLKRAGDYDFIFLASYPPGGASALRQIRAAGIDVPVVSGLAFSGVAWVEGVPDPSNFYSATEGVTTGDDPHPEREQLFDAYRDQEGKDPDNAHALLTGYSAVQAYAKAIEDAGSVDPSKVTDALNKFNDFETAFGKLTWTAECHIPKGQSMIITDFSKDGKEHFVADVTPADEVVDTSPC